MATDEPDEALMQRVSAGDMEAFGELFERYRQPLYGFLLRLLSDAACAEDVTLDVFLRVFERRTRYTPGRPFANWLFTIAHHLAIDTLRSQSRHEQPWLPADDHLPHDGPGPEDVCARSEVAQSVRNAVAALPTQQREVILLREFHGFSYREIANITGRSEEAVRVCAFRARRALRKALAFLRDDASTTEVTTTP